MGTLSRGPQRDQQICQDHSKRSNSSRQMIKETPEGLILHVKVTPILSGETSRHKKILLKDLNIETGQKYLTGLFFEL